MVIFQRQKLSFVLKVENQLRRKFFHFSLYSFFFIITKCCASKYSGQHVQQKNMTDKFSSGWERRINRHKQKLIQQNPRTFFLSARSFILSDCCVNWQEIIHHLSESRCQCLVCECQKNIITTIKHNCQRQASLSLHT